MGSTEDALVISCENVHKTYLLGSEGVPALRGVAVGVKRGEFVLLYGTSGGGKSTLLNVLGTIDLPTKGNLYLFGQRITEQTPDSVLARLRCLRMGFVFQSFNLLPSMSALENVALSMTIAGTRSAAEIRERARDLLISVGLGDRLHHFPSMLSGGEQQRVTIARALANDPEVLLLDEPTGDLDSRNTTLVMDILMKLNRDNGLTMVMVTHDVYMKPYAHRVLYLRDGKLQNVQTVETRVREMALRKLEKDAEKARRGKTDDRGLTVVSVVRNPTDYVTADAQAQISFEDDPGMQQVVSVLFSV
ncbi:ABC transporter, putative [Trypanosoma cruzi]|uniref:ABC transporter n=2 Tax=Trypanosoma cruzi TaxID=5693 RepID=V5D7Y8_TRYCR|nr:ABC transporter, putative [Trypanosoma cruzi]ESS63546.1 ABC transporter [Trypanosoma cruzi Dm28c]KAF8281298.1 putative ABC transporter [Trypanosoma cruzi]PBJ74262.1 ABC transporter [Trypanosoma cruzi cruzi]PWU86708.1 putative ABC transporter [Trypanosoma cruzi]